MFMGKPAPCRMAFRKAPPALLLIVAAVLAQSKVQPYTLAAPPPPQPPSSSPADAAVPAAQPAPQEVAPPRISPGVADRLLGPIALYPDPLLALILPASTAPADISAASAYLVQYADTTRIDRQPWDPSVRALAHYPAILSWMADNIEWTAAVGSAFLASPSEVMRSIQRLRARAKAAGVLVSTPQQQVVVQDNTIEILPSRPESIYAPDYDAGGVYSDEPSSGYGGSLMSFGPALPVGPWLSYDLDWVGCSVWVGGWDEWHGPDGWHHHHHDGKQAQPGAHQWKPEGPGSAPPARGWRGESVPLPHPQFGAPKGAGPAASSSHAEPARASAPAMSHQSAPASAPAPAPAPASDGKNH